MSDLAQVSQIHNELNKQFAYLKLLYENLPLSEKEKTKWVELRRGKKILSLIALHNPGLRESLQKYTFSTTQEETLPVSRESQSFETLLSNLNTFINQNRKSSFVDFLNLGKKSDTVSTLNLFTLTQENNLDCFLEEQDATFIKDIENKIEEQQDIANKLWLSFLVFRQLTESKSGLKKHGCLFAEYSLPGNEKNLFNFPLLVWEAYNHTKTHKERTYSGKRTPVTGFEEITREIFIETALKLVEGNTKNLIAFFRKQAKFDTLNIESKIRINYLVDKAFVLPNKIYENGFSKNHALLKTLCLHGGFRKEDMKKDGSLLLAELLESESFLTKLQDNSMEWVVNISANSKPCKFSQFNNLDIVLKAEKSSDSELIAEENHTEGLWVETMIENINSDTPRFLSI